MSLRARLTALIFGATAPVRPTLRVRVTSTISDGLVSAARQAESIEAGRKAVADRLALSHVERAGHFDVPRFGL